MKNNTPKRPSPSSECMAKAARIIADRIVKWGAHSDVNAARLASDIAARFTMGDNGYELAKELDDYHSYKPDLEMIEELDQMDHEVDSEYKKQIRQWVIDFNITPPFPDNTRVKQGLITGVSSHSPACFEVLMNCDPEDSTRRLILKFEDAELVEASHDESA